jgi:hypothetical protein
MGWIELAQDRLQRWILVNMAVNVEFSKSDGIGQLSSSEFSSTTLLQ